MSKDHLAEELDPNEVFALLSDETRIGILQTLWKTDGHEASFSELRDDVDVSDPGQFNYHLSKLTGHFIAKTQEGYELRSAGQHVIGSLLSGGFTMTGEIDPLLLEDRCSNCGEPLWFEYEQDQALIDCRECSFWSAFRVPPGVFVGYEVADFPHVAERYLRTQIDHVRRGFCPMCHGRIRHILKTLSESLDGVPADVADQPTINYHCERCNSRHQVDPATFLLSHPAVVSFFHDSGIDIEDVSIWSYGFDAVESSTEVIERNPTQVRVAFTAGDSQLSLVLDESLDASLTNRSDR